MGLVNLNPRLVAIIIVIEESPIAVAICAPEEARIARSIDVVIVSEAVGVGAVAIEAMVVIAFAVVAFGVVALGIESVVVIVRG